MTLPIAQRTITITINPQSAGSSASRTGNTAPDAVAGSEVRADIGDDGAISSVDIRAKLGSEDDGQIDVPPPAPSRNDVTYTYWSPISGQRFTNAQTCELNIDRPTYCLFVLDYQTTLAGWTIVKTEPYGDFPKLAFVKGPNNQSLQTFNPYKNIGDIYRYYIFYKNTLTNEEFSEDPQEGNVVR